MLGWAVLMLGLPLALFAALHPANEYRATLGIDALDCQGPFETYLFAVPALAIYGGGLAVHARRWGKRWNAVAALLCLAICAAIALNVARAMAEERRQSPECNARPR